MSAAAVLSGSKRSFFEELPPSPTPLYLSKRVRCSHSSSLADESTIHHFWVPYVISQLRSRFPNIDPKVLETSLQQSGYDFDATVNNLEEKQKEFSSDSAAKVEQLPLDGPGWIDLAIGEMTSATSVDDARARSAKLLERFEKSISACVSAEITQTKNQKEEENMILKKQREAAVDENVFLKGFLHAQTEQCKEYEGKYQELKDLEEYLRKLEVEKYGLELELSEALKNNSNVPDGRFNPDVF